jgi:hypothetical protein
MLEELLHAHPYAVITQVSRTQLEAVHAHLSITEGQYLWSFTAGPLLHLEFPSNAGDLILSKTSTPAPGPTYILFNWHRRLLSRG